MNNNIVKTDYLEAGHEVTIERVTTTDGYHYLVYDTCGSPQEQKASFTDARLTAINMGADKLPDDDEYAYNWIDAR